MNTSGQPLVQPAIGGYTKYKPVVFALISLLTIFFLYQVVGGGITYFLLGTVPLGNSSSVLRLTMMLAEILFILIPTFFLTKLQVKDWKSFLRLRKADWYYLGLAIIGVITLQQLLEIYLYLQDLIPLPDHIRHMIDHLEKAIEQTERMLASSNSPMEFCFVVLAVALTPAICEETLFRGLVQSNFELPMSKNRAIIWTGMIFAAYHLNPFTFVALCALGIYLSYLVSVSGSILVPMAAHFTNNFISTLILYKFGKESLIASQDQRAGAGSIIVWSVILFLIFLTTIRLTMSHKNSQSSLGEARIYGTGQERGLTCPNCGCDLDGNLSTCPKCGKAIR